MGILAAAEEAGPREPMRWIVGLDLKGLSQGAIHFAGWLHQRSEAEKFVAVHVVEGRPDSRAQAAVDGETFRDWLQAAAEKEVAKAGARDAFGDVESKRVPSAEEGLLLALEERQADGLVLGRKTPRGKDAVVRLGRVARRLVRRLESPLIIVPPDLRAEEIGDGPVVVATDLGADAVGALRFGEAQAKALGRELVLVHGIQLPSHLDHYLPADAWSTMQAEVGTEGHEAAVAWAAAHNVEARIVVVDGPIVRALWTAAVKERACMLVCGSRRLSLLERIFTSSVGSELAASSPLPVAIVPPPAELQPE